MQRGPGLTRSQAISSKDAASLDQDLIEAGGFSLDQLMELAGLSVSQAGELLSFSTGTGH